MLSTDHDLYIPESQYQVVGTSNRGEKKLYHVGYRYGEPIFCVAESPDKIVPSFAITIHHLLTFNPMGWNLDVEKINSLYLQQQTVLNNPPTSE